MTTSNKQLVEPTVEPVIVNGPIAPVAAGPIFQVTLASGAVLTNPGAFPDGASGVREVNPYVAEDGHLLA